VEENKNRLEEWISEVKKSRSYGKLYSNTGLYDGMGMYFGMSECQKGDLIRKLHNNELFEFWGSDYKPEHYSNYFEKVERFGLGKKGQFYFSTPDKPIIFPEDSNFSNNGKEKGFEYSTSLQLYFWGDMRKVVRGYDFLVNKFILPNKIPTYVLAGNCKDEKFKDFSVFIND
jgi:hypothetical protein